MPQIEYEYSILKMLLGSDTPPFIYGVNSLVGHLDNNRLNISKDRFFQNELLENHAIDLGFGYYNDWQVNCIFYTKLINIVSGGTGISPNLFKELVTIYTSKEYNLKIPTQSSYSCGDVIPAANFAMELSSYFNNDFQFTGKDAISLINGNFISIGLSISILPRLLDVLDHLIENTIFVFNTFNIDYKILKTDNALNEFLSQIYELIKKQSSIQTTNHQPSVSLRAALKNINLLYQSIIELKEEIEGLLELPSDNPLITSTGEILSNSSFYSPSLSLKLSSIIDSLLFNSWNVERRIQYLLSGKVDGVPQNISTLSNRLGLIQIPKMATNILQNIRLDYGTRVFATGLETSYGIEDSWTCVEKQVSQLISLMDQFDSILKIEKIIIDYYEKKDYSKLKETLPIISSKTIIKEKYEFKYVSNL